MAETTRTTPETPDRPLRLADFRSIAANWAESASVGDLKDVLDHLPNFAVADLEDRAVAERLTTLQRTYRAKATTGDGGPDEASMSASEVETAFAAAGVITKRPDGELGWVNDANEFSKRTLGELEEVRVVSAWHKVQTEIAAQLSGADNAGRRAKVVDLVAQAYAEGRLTHNTAIDPEGQKVPGRLRELEGKLLPDASPRERQTFLVDVSTRAAQLENVATPPPAEAQDALFTDRVRRQQDAKAEAARQAIAAQAQETERQKQLTDLEAKGKTAGVDLNDLEASHTAALKEAATIDSEIAASERVRLDYEARIAAETDPAHRHQLRNEMTGRTAEHPEGKWSEGVVARAAIHQKEINQRAAVTRSAVHEARRRNEKLPEPIRLDRTQSGYREQAAAQRALLRADAAPFLEVKKGGFLHRQANKGPKVIERYYRSTEDPNVVIVERALRKNGELLSQTVFRGKETVREKAELGYIRYLPPHELKRQMAAVRAKDQELYRPTVRDYISGLRDPGWLQREYTGTLGADGYRQHKLRKSRGGFFFWLFGERT